LNLSLWWDDFKQIPHLALKKVAQPFDGRKINPRCCLVIKGRDGAAVQAGPLRNVRDAKFVATHKGGKVAANHDFDLAGNEGYCAA